MKKFRFRHNSDLHTSSQELSSVNDSSDNNGGVETEGLQKRGFSNKVKSWAMRKPKWTKNKVPNWILVLGVILLISLIILLVFLVILPLVVQRVVDGSKVHFTRITITKPVDNSVEIEAEATLSDLGSFDAEIEEMELSIFYNDEKLGTISLPSLNVEGGKSLQLHLQNHFVIENKAAFDKFGIDALNKETVTWTLNGRPTLRTLGLTFKDVIFDKQADIKGFNGLNDISVRVFDLSNSTQDRINMFAVVELNSPSILELVPIGDVTFDLFYEEVFVGILFGTELELNMGISTFTLTGYIPSDANSAGVSALVSRYLAGEESVIIARYKTGTIQLYENLLRATELPTKLKQEPTYLIQEISFSGIEVEPKDGGVIPMAANITATVQSPLGVNAQLIIREISMETQMIYNGEVLGSLSASVDIPDTDQLTINLTTINSSLVLQGNGSSFQDFLRDFVINHNVTIFLAGTIDTVVTLPGGINVTLSGLPLSNDASLLGNSLESVLTEDNGFLGMDGLKQITIGATDVIGGYSGGLYINLTLSIFNPSSAICHFSSISLDIFYSGIYLGNTTLTSLTLGRGFNTLRAVTTYVHPINQTIGKQFLSNFVNRQSQNITLQGGTPTIRIMTKALQAMNSSVIFPGLNVNLILGVRIILLPLASVVRMRNPWSSNVMIQSTDLRIVSGGTLISELSHNFSNGWNINGHSNSVSESIPVPNLSGFNFQLLQSLDLSGNMQVFIPNASATSFHTELYYFQNNIQTCVLCSSPPGG